MTQANLGNKFRHVSRGTVYMIVGKTSGNLLRDCHDRQECFWWQWTDGYEEYDEISPNPPQLAKNEVITMRLPLRVQISNSVERAGTIVIYQDVEYWQLWARHEDEFLDGRFKKVKE